ncbi:MAG: kynureninase, partial [Pseudomonadales bacterium]
MSDRARFEALDAADPLAALREAFTLPPGVRYFDGNSLGPQPKTARAAVLRVLEQGWGEALIRGWNDEGWFDLPDRTAEVLAPLLGAAPGSVAVADSTSLNIF